MIGTISKAFAYSVLAGILLLGGPRPAFADTVYANLGPLSLPIPWDNVNAVYMYSVTEKVNQVGGEMAFADLKIGSYQNNPIDLQLTAGGVVDPTGSTVGTGFVGVNFYLPNPIPQLTAISVFNPGLFGGYDIHNHLWEFGLKASVNIFRG